jgi:GNAT superfamily N-acetyltransferase
MSALNPMAGIRLMTGDDLAAGMRLKSQAGWNQVEADWQRFLAMQPDGCFVAECDGAVVGTTVACVFDNVAWLAMVLVETAHRGRGIGTALVRHALEFIDRLGVRSVRLDATALGRPVYEKLGFAAQYELARYEGVLPPETSTGESQVEAACPEEYERICALDRAIAGADRRTFLMRLFEESPDDVRVMKRRENIHGYVAVRRGSGAVQVGPCIAEPDAGAVLLRDAARRYGGTRVFVDVPLGNETAVACANALTLTESRRFVRMCRGPATGEDVSRLWASSGPELG